MIIEILHNPAYAGAFVYGRRPLDPMQRKPGRRGSGVVRKPMEEWVALQQGAYPAYISWEQFLHNQARLLENTQEAHAKQAAVAGARGADRIGGRIGGRPLRAVVGGVAAAAAAAVRGDADRRGDRSAAGREGEQ